MLDHQIQKATTKWEGGKLKFWELSQVLPYTKFYIFLFLSPHIAALSSALLPVIKWFILNLNKPTMLLLMEMMFAQYLEI